MSADFTMLTEKVNQSRDEILATMSKGRDEMRAHAERARRNVEQQADEITSMSAARTSDEAATGWRAMQDRWQSHIAQSHQRTAGSKAVRDVREAEMEAEAAEDYAEDAIGFAIAAIQEAEYAVLNAALKRSDADALTDA